MQPEARAFLEMGLSVLLVDFRGSGESTGSHTTVGFDAFNHNPDEYAAAVECPTLFLHGTDDPRARVDEARQVFDAIAGPKHFQSFPQLGHEPALRVHPEDWHRALTPFVRTVE
jgi:pimeloyl-ACP methyl ester carboxylesterase